jgi:hypothetical protein
MESEGSHRQTAGLTNRNCIGGSYTWMRGQISSKSSTCTEGVAVYAAGISGTVGVHYPGRSVGEAGNRDRVEILWHRRETSRLTEKTNIDLRACQKATCIERCGWTGRSQQRAY